MSRDLTLDSETWDRTNPSQLRLLPKYAAVSGNRLALGTEFSSAFRAPLDGVEESIPAGAEAQEISACLTARLKPCPFKSTQRFKCDCTAASPNFRCNLQRISG